jgi:uncharacterized membrane protein (UPF0136 family)
VDETPRQMRVSTTVRGVIMGALIALYSWLMDHPAGWAGMLLVAAAVQLVIIIARRFVPPDLMPRALFVIETIADGATVLLFALGVLGPIAQLSNAV